MILGHASVLEAHEAACVAPHIGIVRHEHDGGAFAIELLEEGQDLRRGRLSRAPVGSSASRRLGLFTSARAMATRCCCPPDNCIGR